MITRRSLLAAPAVIAGAGAIRPAWARAPLSNALTPPVYRFKVGEFEVTAIADGTLAIPPEVALPASQKEPDVTVRLLRQAALPAGPVRSFVNTYLVNTGDRLILVDTGTGATKDFGPDLGKLPAGLAAAGIDPGLVDAVVLTHLHPDHTGGLAPAGRVAFPNAELVVPEIDYAFWTDPGEASRAPAEFQPFFKMAQDAVRPYQSNTRRISSGEIAPGLSFVAAPGHTPGHSAVLVASGSQQLLIWGDLVHLAALQFDRPDWSIAFDTDQAAAVATRRRLFDQASADRLLVAGMHLPFPGVGYVTRRDNAYAWSPQLWPTG